MWDSRTYSFPYPGQQITLKDVLGGLLTDRKYEKSVK